MGILADLLGGVGADLYGEIPEEIKDLYTDPLPELTAPDVTFQPFTVTGSAGYTTSGPDGTTYNLSPEQQAMQRQLFGGASKFFEQATQDPAQREQAVFDRMMTAMSPSQERERLALENRLAAQGRLGVQTSQFGGTPEGLALAKAQEEQRYTAMLGAMQQAQAEQQQQAGLGGMFLGQSYAPMQALLTEFSPGLQTATLADVARRQQGEFDYEAQLANLEGVLGQRQALGNLFGSSLSSAGTLVGSLISGAGGLLGGALSEGGIFNR